jgi:hypothetical protein
VDHPPEINQIHRVLQLARELINHQQPDLALAELQNIKADAERDADSRECAEFFLEIAEAYCAKCDDHAAATYLRLAAERIEALSNACPDLRYRLMDRFGDFYGRAGRFFKARDSYACAMSCALKLGKTGSEKARIQLKLYRVEYLGNSDPEAENLKTLRRVGNAGNFTWEEQLAAWHLHVGENVGSMEGLRFARGRGTCVKVDERYLQQLLNSVRAENS